MSAPTFLDPLWPLVFAASAAAWWQWRAARAARTWGRHLLQSQELRQEELARSLHNDLLQRLCRVSLELDGAALERMGDVVRDVRTLSHRLFPPALRHLDLEAALEELAERHGEDEVTVAVTTETPLERPVAAVLYRTVEEWLDATDGAVSRHVTVEAGRRGRIRLRFTSAGSSASQATTYALRQRVRMVGGSCTYEREEDAAARPDDASSTE